MFDSSSAAAIGRPARPPGLEFIPPNIVRSAGRQRRVGAVVFRLLRSLAAAAGKSQLVKKLEMEVWGGPVRRDTVSSACRRARLVLVEIEHPLRVALDGDRVTLV